MDYLNIPFIRSKNPDELKDCDRFMFPGDGDDAYAMAELKKSGFDAFVREQVASGKPLLGICVGSQIIFEHSEEGDVDCLGLLKGEIRHFSSVWADMEKCAETAPAATSATVAPSATAASPRATIGLKVPHIGWNDISCTNGGSRLLAGVPEHSDVYFVHSYLIQPADWSIVKATADYGCPVPACVESGSITAFQFHPEKSGKCGLKMLENFISRK